MKFPYAVNMANKLDQEVQAVLGKMGVSADVLEGVDRVVVHLPLAEARKLAEISPLQLNSPVFAQHTVLPRGAFGPDERPLALAT